MSMGAIPETLIVRAPEAEWGARFTHGNGDTTSFSLQVPASIALPYVMDGLVAAVLPAAMRCGGMLRVRGPISRRALRNFTELAEAWASWRPGLYSRLNIEPDEVADLCPKPSAEVRAVAAWSGSLRSTHTIIRHHRKLLPQGYDVRHVIRVTGCGDNGADGNSSYEALCESEFEQQGIPLHFLRFRSAGPSLVDPIFGEHPIAVAALHAFSGEADVGLIARRWLWAAQLRYPRPEPMVPDLWSGGALPVRFDGGAASLPQMVRDCRDFLPLISNCRRRKRFEAPCGRCHDCKIFALAIASQGLNPRYPVPGRAGVAGIALMDPEREAEAESILRDAPAWHGGGGNVLAWHLARVKRALRIRNTLRWMGSLSRTRAIWPR